MLFFAIMEGSSSSHISKPSSPSRHNVPPKPNTDKPENEALPKQSEETQETQVTSFIGSNWPSLPSESGSPIPPGQKSKPENPSPSPWKIQQKNPEDYEKDRVGKYADYFKGNEILPIPEIILKMEPRIVSLVDSLSDWRRKGSKTWYGKRASHANTSADGITQHGMSCSHLENKRLRLPLATLQPISYDCRRNTKGPVGFG